MSEEGAELSEKEHAEGLSKKELFGKRREEIVLQVANGEDKEGALIRGLFIEAIESSSESLGAVARVHNQAQESAKNLHQPGEANKLLISLKTLHQQADLGEYEIEVSSETDEQGMKKARKEKMLQDLGDLPDKMAEHYMGDYYDRKTKAQAETENLRSLVTGERLSRHEVRVAAYRQEREEGKLFQLEVDVLTRLNRGDKSPDLFKFRFRRTRPTLEGFNGLGDRGEEEKVRLIEERTKSLQAEIAQEQGEKAAGAYKNLEAGKRNEVVSQLLESELKEENLKTNLESAVAAVDAESICDLVSEIKAVNVERKKLQAELRVVLANQRFTMATESFSEARIELGKRVRGFRNVREAASRVTSAYRDIEASARGVTKEVLRKEARPAVDKLTETKESVSERFGKLLNTIDSAYERTGRRVAERVKQSSEGIRERVKGRYVEIKSGLARKRIETKRWFYEQRHSLAVEKLQISSAFGTEWSVAKKHTGLAAEQVITVGIRPDKEGFKQTHESIRKAKERFYATQNKKYKKMRKNNPLFRKLDDELENDVRLTDEIEEKLENSLEQVKAIPPEAMEIIEPERSSRPTEGVSEGDLLDALIIMQEGEPEISEQESSKESPKASELREGAKFYELTRRFNTTVENESYFLYWWDGKTLRFQEVDREGKGLQGSEVYSHPSDSEEDAREKINNHIGLYDRPDIEIDRNLEIPTRKELSTGETAT